MVEGSDDEIEQLFGKDDERNNDTPSTSKEPDGSNRREKIAAYLKNQQEKKMTPKRTYSEIPNGSDQYFPSNCFNNIGHQPDVLNTESD